MEQTARKFVRRVLLIHGLLLLAVIALVLSAARGIYTKTREQAIKQAIVRQELLAAQTADGITSYYTSIRNDLDLLRRAEKADSAASQPASGPATRPGLGPGPGFGPGLGRLGMPRPLLGEIQGANSMNRRGFDLLASLLWKQLSERAAHLYVVDMQRLEEKPHPGEKPHPLTREKLVQAIESIDAWNVPVAEPQERVVRKMLPWLRDVKHANISPYVTGDVAGGANLVCVPTFERGWRLLVAEVPINIIATKFLDKLSYQSHTALLLDERLTTMDADEDSLVGKSEAREDPMVGRLAREAMKDNAMLTRYPLEPAGLSALGKGGPRIVSVCPVPVLDKRWALVMALPLSEVDNVVNPLFGQALFWAVFIGLSMTAILLSTALQMIRNRIRMERARHETLARELKQAREIQLAWLPASALEGAPVDIAAANHPANHISGDFYDWFKLPDGRIVVTIGDVTGHGMSAAFLMATTQLLVRGTMMRVGDPGRCLREINQQLCAQIFVGQFVSILVIVLDLAQAELLISAAGHYPPLVRGADGIEPLPIEPEMVLGVDKDAVYRTDRFPLPNAGQMFLYTDGVLDVATPAGQRFGHAGLRNVLSSADFPQAQTMLDALLAAVTRFRGPAELPDDLTMVAVRVAPSIPDHPQPLAPITLNATP